MSYEPKYKIVTDLFGYYEDGKTAYLILRQIQQLDPDVVGIDLIMDARAFVEDRFSSDGVEFRVETLR